MLNLLLYIASTQVFKSMLSQITTRSVLLLLPSVYQHTCVATFVLFLLG